MKHRGSIIASEIDREYKRRLQWKERIERQKQGIIILDEHSREPLIIEKEDK